jgi:hypothetical protein
MGTIDEQGLCRLCGAPQRPPTRLGRLAEAGGAALELVLQPAFLGVVALGAVLVAAAVVASAGLHPPAGAPRPGLLTGLDPQATLAAARTDPLGAVGRFLLPALMEGVLFFVLLMAVLFLFRRRRPVAPPGRRRPAD